jgi:hypothetical protein
MSYHVVHITPGVLYFKDSLSRPKKKKLYVVSQKELIEGVSSKPSKFKRKKEDKLWRTVKGGGIPVKYESGMVELECVVLGVRGGKGFVSRAGGGVLKENRVPHYSMTGPTECTINIIRSAVGNCLYRRTDSVVLGIRRL